MSTSPHPRLQEVDMLHEVARSRIGHRWLPHPHIVPKCNTSLSVSATVGEEPEVEVALV